MFVPKKKLNHKELSYRPDTDGLRALAVLLVIIFHSFPSLLPGGFIGVDIFFVISGYLISRIILNDIQNKKFSFADFYARRIRRIFPSLIIVLLFCLTAGWFFLYAEEFKELGVQTVSATIFAANLELLRESGYFDNSSELKPLLHLWSLGVEEQFYILWPILLFFFAKTKLFSHTNPTESDSFHNKFFWIIIVTAVVSFIFNIAIINKFQAASFYLPFSRFFEITIGAILAYFHAISKLDQNPKSLLRHSSWVGLTLIILGLIIINKNSLFPGFLALLPCLGAALIIMSGSDNWLNKKFFGNKLMVYIGLISYPLYLWHWPLISFATIIKGRTPRPELIFGLLALSFLLAFLSYKFVEMPIRHKKINSRKTLALLISAMFFIFIASISIILFSGFENRISAAKILTARTMNRAKLADSVCLKKYASLVKINYCRISGNDEDKKIFVIGDSHSQTIFNGYETEAVKNSYQIIHLANSGCPFFDEKNNENKHEIVECNKIFRKIIDIISKEKPRLILFANNAWIDRRDDFFSGMNNTISLLGKDSAIVYFLQIPKSPFLPLSCLDRKECEFERADFDRDMVNYKLKIMELKKLHKNLQISDPTQAFCNDRKCFVLEDDKFIYAKDGKHLSTYGGEKVAKKFPIEQFY